MKKIDFSVGEKVIVIERTSDGEIFEWDGEITIVTEGFVETKHHRNPITHPQWLNYFRAYMDTWVKHYYNADEELINVKKK